MVSVVKCEFDCARNVAIGAQLVNGRGWGWLYILEIEDHVYDLAANMSYPRESR